MPIEGTEVRELPEGRESAEEAGYLELKNAEKDGDCSKVNVPGGISRDLGCCDLYQPESEDTESFKCGVCEYVRTK
jgi:hypothetical protein